MMVWLVIYAMIGVTGMFIGLARNRAAGDDAQVSIVLAALLWPLALGDFLWYIFRWEKSGFDVNRNWIFRGGSRPEVPVEPQERWKQEHANIDYNKMAFGEEKEDAAGGGPDFIAGLAGETEAPLREEFTITYKPTGISKTYPAGTMFPSALVNDWKRGFFMGKETDEAGGT